MKQKKLASPVRFPTHFFFDLSVGQAFRVALPKDFEKPLRDLGRIPFHTEMDGPLQIKGFLRLSEVTSEGISEVDSDQRDFVFCLEEKNTSFNGSSNIISMSCSSK